ncbi:hypothetical protein Aph01nite_35590 [Acrocarpospora phusangensis]|uniref:Uncharacterized protein n=1 Tax=Acrocarpospora phusangensis TaxID=1070424 RepID=A0A919UKQ2_9ACTN|nr:hypothetical protein Aph01nite_35590 [Acrocarpospora phusangensis]
MPSVAPIVTSFSHLEFACESGTPRGVKRLVRIAWDHLLGISTPVVAEAAAYAAAASAR